MIIDLEKLIAKRIYTVPIKADELCDALLIQLKLDCPWVCETKRPKSAAFTLDLEEFFTRLTLDDEGKPSTPENIAKVKEKFNLARLKSTTSVLERLVENYPIEVSYIVKEERIDGCLVHATCKPAYYRRFVKGLSCSNAPPQDSRLHCEDFLNEIFIGGLGGSEVQELRKVSSWLFLLNDSQSRQITAKVYEMLSEATTCVLLMGWIGTDCLPKLKELKDAKVTIRAITHSLSELKSPVPREMQRGYSELVSLLGTSNVSVNPYLHGRGLIVDNKALVGSMDFNAHSLSGEHIEFAVYTEDIDTVRSLRSYFEAMFKPLK